MLHVQMEGQISVWIAEIWVKRMFTIIATRTLEFQISSRFNVSDTATSLSRGVRANQVKNATKKENHDA